MTTKKPNQKKRTALTITGGELSGRVIRIPSEHCHPMGDRQRLALFNILESHNIIAGARVLDLFSGSGALGIESLSRGAKFVLFNEINRALCDRLSTNLVTLRIEEFCEIVMNPAQELCSKYAEGRFAAGVMGFDLIFADPPYNDLQLDFLDCICKLLEPPYGVFVLSIPKNIEAPEIRNLTLVEEKTYAGCHLCFYVLDTK